VLALAPADAANLAVRNEGRIGPDTVLIESAADPAAERREVRVIDEHHRLAERLLMADHDLVEHEAPKRDADGKGRAVVRRSGTRPDQQRGAPPLQESPVLEEQTSVRHQEADAKQQKRALEDVHRTIP